MDRDLGGMEDGSRRLVEVGGTAGFVARGEFQLS